MEDYKEKTEKLLLETVKLKEEADKRLLALEIVICVLSVVLLLGGCAFAACVPVAEWIKALVCVASFAVSMAGLMSALRIEQTAGYYECANCRHKYIPTFNSVLWAPHFGRTRHMKCPECHKRTWNKKVIKKDGQP